ncbi:MULTISPECIES: YerC/YecD family TrpR-related protein [Virgibacillus]|uniref:Trp repressor protein n=1 Tax=Virgibacillus dokdonensis TaxID=302167 RepID=A0A2K9J093_9BACI|nr:MULTISPECIES: YerC/YecD family TrpR-related protein [Virgibacillus]AUJ25336.1 Trp repressor protein [Virgibacillus dokdonensis]NWO13826.1 transcriptional regulator [Virgibacillus sp.]
MLIDEIRGEELDDFFCAFLELQTIEECYCFFDDLCTVNEIKAMLQRFRVAKMLYNDNTYCQIEDETGASTATISRTKRSLYHGNNMYDILFSRMKKSIES